MSATNEKPGYPASRTKGLKPWKPGQSGNPGGRPKKDPITRRYEVRLERKLPPEFMKQLNAKGADLPPGSTYGDAIAAGIIQVAIKGKADNAKEVREAIEGKATARIAITDTDGDDIQLGETREELLAQLREFTERVRVQYFATGSPGAVRRTTPKTRPDR